MSYPRSSRIVAFAAVAALLLGATTMPASASSVGMSLCDASGACTTWSGTSGTTGTTWTDIGMNGTSWTATVNTLSVSPDPYVTNDFTITNTTASTQTYAMSTTLGVAPLTPSTLTKGSVGYTLTQNSGSATATLSAPSGGAIYTALIDGNDFHSLFNAPYSVSASNGGSASNTASFGGSSTTPTYPGPAVNSSIGINMNFTLTPGDSVSFTSRFEVVPVPLPTTLGLFGSGLIGMVGIARRNRKKNA